MVSSEFVFGQGKVSGYLGFFFASLCLAGVLCFRFPEYLTSPELRAVYQVSFMRTLLAFFLCVAFGLSVVSFFLAKKKILSLISMLLVLISVLLGGSQVPVPETVKSSPAFGLDWFVLDLLVLTLVFVPLERLLARLPEQRVFRTGWKVDLVHFFVSHMLVQVTTFLILAPALFAARFLGPLALQTWVASQPFLVQVLEIVVIADFTQYWIHRTFHEIPWLWRFHQVHHSTVEMDWLAGSRLHLVDILVTRSVTLIPLFLFGFETTALKAYLVFVAVFATFIHTNFRYELSWLGRWIVTPFFHHWHHAIEPEAINKNYGVHIPWFDRMFGTNYEPPGKWPPGYGVHGVQLPVNYLLQLILPFRPGRG